MPELTEYQRERLELIEHKLKFVSERPLVLCLEDAEYLKPTTHYFNDLVALAGGKPVSLPDAEDLYTAIAEQNPDVLIIAPPSGSAVQAMGSIPQLLERLTFTVINAIKNNRIYVIDADFFVTQCPDMVDRTELLAELLYPKQFIFGYEGKGWIKFGL